MPVGQRKTGKLFMGIKSMLRSIPRVHSLKKYTVTDASVNDSKALEDLLEDKALHADSVYTA